MALLYRFTKLNDRYNTGIFTFIVTRSVTRDLHRDATTKDFYYGYHRWAISFTRANDRALGVYLILRNPSPSTKCYADFTLTLLNREHFSRNEQHQEKQCKFTTEHTTQGVSKWILMNEIQSRKFGDETGEFLLELSLGNILTIFETDLQVSNNGQLKSGKFESASFSFGSFEWNVSIVIHNYGATSTTTTANSNNNNNNNSNDNTVNESSSSTTSSNRIIYVFLNRLSGFDHPCRVQYRVIIGDDEQKNHEDSGVLDQISDAGGRIRGFQMQHSLTDLLKSNGTVRVFVELHCCNAISEAKVPIVRNPSPTISCYDRNKQGWCIEADMDSEFLRLKLFFMDLHSVPRNHLRYISWIAYVIAKDPRHGVRESLAVTNAPHSNYYVQDGIDMGAMMDTTLPVSKIKETPKIYLENEKLTVHVEWCDSIMLFNHIYHKYDDITRIHGHQMRREILALSNENYSLEKQLISYQKTIGHTGGNSRSLSKDNSSNESGSIKSNQPQQLYQQQQQQQHKHHIGGRRSSSEIQLNVEHLSKNKNPSSSSSSSVIIPKNNQQQQISQNIQRNGHQDLGSSIQSTQLQSIHQNQSIITNQQQQQQQQLVINARNIHPKQQQQQQSIFHHHHHKLPTIPNQPSQQIATPPPYQHSFNNINSAVYTSMITNSPKLNAIRKASLTHYGSLPNNTSSSSMKFFYSEDQGDYGGPNVVTNLTPPPSQSQPLSPRIVQQRSLHRSRERNYSSPLTSTMSIHQTSSYGSGNSNINGLIPPLSYNTLDNEIIHYRAPISPSLTITQPFLKQQQPAPSLSQSASSSPLRHGQHHNHHHQYGNRFINPTVIIDNENCQTQQSQQALLMNPANGWNCPQPQQTMTNNLPVNVRTGMDQNDYLSGYIQGYQ
ncbi:hypothetical protein DERP_008895 [Dermatophagoides pteronyssinus]|uniref:MATH domain-containing protein n=1 Tax=Dermatophagoides pteronyssinus TaxID=6956 RepID=A0ABQ8JNN2_DERPT|nr:hypothetical protein DERP_008895 [Dermatophagoides pteronyssinus]